MAQVLAAAIVLAMGFFAGWISGVSYLINKIKEDESDG